MSTSWTNCLTREQLVEVLHRAGLSFVVENLHAEWATPKAPGRQRVEDIYFWIRKVHPGQLPHSLPLLALDDDESGWSLADSLLDQAGQVVLCEVWKGLTDEKLALARKLLLAQLERRRCFEIT